MKHDNVMQAVTPSKKLRRERDDLWFSAKRSNQYTFHEQGMRFESMIHFPLPTPHFN